MNREEIIAMAREAGINVEQGFLLRFAGVEDDLERFAALIAAAAKAEEREACAKACDEAAHDWHQHAKGGPVAVYNACAAAIRARGQT